MNDRGSSRDEPAVFDVIDVESQELLVEVRGRDVLFLERNAEGLDIDSDALMPDWVELFTRAVNAGMLCGASYPPWTSGAVCSVRELDLKNARQQWWLKVCNVDRGAFLVLMNLLGARSLDGLSVRTISEVGPAPLLDLRTVQYPGYFSPLPFRLDWDVPMRETRNRSLRIEFVKEAADEAVEAAEAALKTWTDLLIFGAYPIERSNPAGSLAFPDEPYQFDAFTVAQGFLEIFACDEATFNAPINWAHTIHNSRADIAELAIR